MHILEIDLPNGINQLGQPACTIIVISVYKINCFPCSFRNFDTQMDISLNWNKKLWMRVCMK